MPSQLSISITGMHCQRCCESVESAIKGLPGVESAAVSLGRADVLLDESVTPRQDLLSAIRRAGDYDVGGFSAADRAADAD